MQRIIIGIDPGLKGAIGVIHIDNSSEFLEKNHIIKYSVYDIPTIVIQKAKNKTKTMIDLVKLNKIVCDICDENIEYKIEAWVEDVHSLPQQSIVAMFSMGRGLGNIEMSLTCYEIPIHWVSPQRWKKEIIFMAGSDKLISVDKAKELFPLCEFETKRGRKLDGRAEAMLIGEYGRRQNIA